MLLSVALDSTMIFVKKVGTSATWDSFILDFPVGVSTVIVTVP